MQVKKIITLLNEITISLIIQFMFLVAMANSEPLFATGNPSEYEVKAAFIYNFAKFIEWPDTPAISSDSAFVIGVIGKDPFGSVFEQTIGDKRIHGKPIVIQRFETLDQLKPVHILFISRSEESRTRLILNQLDGLPVVTVAEFDRFIDFGGLIHLYLEENRVRFAVNRAAARLKKLDISAKLLDLARIY